MCLLYRRKAIRVLFSEDSYVDDEKLTTCAMIDTAEYSKFCYLALLFKNIVVTKGRRRHGGPAV
jgi:hypothetical protein